MKGFPIEVINTKTGEVEIIGSQDLFIKIFYDDFKRAIFPESILPKDKMVQLVDGELKLVDIKDCKNDNLSDKD